MLALCCPSKTLSNTSACGFGNGGRVSTVFGILAVRLSLDLRDLVLSKLFAECIALPFSWPDDICFCALCELPGLDVGIGGVCDGLGDCLVSGVAVRLPGGAGGG